MRPMKPDRAVDLFARLSEAKQLHLQPALSRAVSKVGVRVVDRELEKVAPAAALNKLASLGIRGERVFPTPSMLREKPTLVAYYRMLLGLPQKAFSAEYGWGRFITAEKTGRLTPRLDADVDNLCAAFAAGLSELVQRLDDFSDVELHELTLLTLGGTLQGGRNVRLGQAATAAVFKVIQDLIAPHILALEKNLISIRNAPGRTLTVRFGSDPDVGVQEEVEGRDEPVVAMEIKGGTDRSNAHNRAGEAEKSHIRAASEGFQHRWTIMSLMGVQESAIKESSPHTTRFFEISQLLATEGRDFKEFRRQLVQLLSLPEGDAGQR